MQIIKQANIEKEKLRILISNIDNILKQECDVFKDMVVIVMHRAFEENKTDYMMHDFSAFFDIISPVYSEVYVTFFEMMLTVCD